MQTEDDSLLLDDEPIIFKGGTLTLSTEDHDADEHTSFLNNGKLTDSCSLTKPWPSQDPKSFFCYRDDLVTQTLAEIKEFLMKEDPHDIQGVWLLTEISFWNNERERVVAITKNYLIVIKYDFIALKILNHFKVPLQNIDTIIVSDCFDYPPSSIANQVEGITSGVMHILRSFALRVAGNSLTYPNHQQIMPERRSPINQIFGVEFLKARSRNVTGVRPMWNKGEPIKFSTRWNPFTNNIPWATFTSHPLLWHKSFSAGEERMRIYDVDYFISRLIKAVQQTPRSTFCQVQHKPILLQNYFGLLSIIHNRNNLGFFKVRGKFSF